MIGRTLSKILSIGEEIGKNNHTPFEYPLLGLCQSLDRVVLPLQPMCYQKSKNGEQIEVCEDIGFSGFVTKDGDIKRALAKAFDKRRKVNVGSTFKLTNARSHQSGFGGEVCVDYEVHRVSSNTVAVTSNDGAYLVSSSEKGLLKNRISGYDPMLYHGVIF